MAPSEFTSGQKFCEFSILFTGPLHFSFQHCRVLNQLSSTIHSSPKNRVIDFPPNFWKQIEVSKTSVQIWIHFMITVHFFRSSRMPKTKLKFCYYFFLFHIFFTLKSIRVRHRLRDWVQDFHCLFIMLIQNITINSITSCMSAFLKY